MKKEKMIPSGSQELKKRLPRGAIKALATKYGYSLVWIGKVVAGHAGGDPRIIEDAEILASIEDRNREAFNLALCSENRENQAV
jgi:hypothetical protein